MTAPDPRPGTPPQPPATTPVPPPGSPPGARPGATRGALSLYATGSVGMGVWVTVPGLLLLYFLTDVLGVPALLAGPALLLPKVVDVVVHPLLGSRSDREARRHGHRRRMMRTGLLLGVALVGMFSVPSGLTGAPAALWVACWFVAGNLLFAGFQVPYLTTPSDLRVGYHERTRVFMFRMILLTVGLLGAGVAAPALSAAGGRSDYTRMALLLAVVMAVSAGVALTGVRRLTEECGFRPPDADAGHSTPADLKVAWRDRNFRALVLSYLFTGTTTHLFLAALPYVTAYVFGETRLTALFMGLFLGPALFAGPVWSRWSRRYGKQRGLLLSQGAFAAGSLALLPGAALGGTAGVVLAAVDVMVMGIAFSGLQLFAFSMLPDAVAAAEAAGSSKAGAYTGVWTATEATGTAVGPYLYSAVLALGGFVSSTAGDPVTQSGTALGALVVGFTAVPAVLMAIALWCQRRCALDAAA
ncbi:MULTISPECIES: MFS transporter [unclassified Streptomyces]|uniref:MFS transporter n=1 Tax=unclassified Streptomyces TaxID=2593676 RepID=UPI0016607C1D|nr:MULTISPECIES: MFS transporter [unclassified Streptomyces]MBD0710797.1 MFS transporter [Streptomyces sp. CBMA291]MBD0718150.1 MFS transporter [Streptomyces sp. CBMA370]